MSQEQLQTPVAFIIFNRPDTTSRVFQEIRRAAPTRLLVIADGPRPARAGEAEKCAAARAVIEGVDWPCEVSTNYSKENLGCKLRISSGLDWVFSLVEEAIIIEDDCLPEPSFFPFCAELLERYRHDTRVFLISGDNFQFGARRTGDSYYFSRIAHIWGWATWRRTWQLYDREIKLWPVLRDEGWLEEYYGDPRVARHWREAFDSVHDGRIDCWGHQMNFTCMVNHGLCVLPNVNLISNLGFGVGATHTTVMCRLAEMPTKPMAFPLRHPRHMIRDARADGRTEKEQFMWPTFWFRVKRLARHLLRKAGLKV